MRVVLSTYGSRRDVEPMAGLAVEFRTLAAEPLGNVVMPQVTTGVWR